MPGHWSGAEPRLTPSSSINVQWLHLDFPIHCSQPLNLIIVEFLLSFCWCGLLAEQREHLGPGLGHVSFWRSYSVKVLLPPRLVALLSLSKRSLRNPQTSANSQPKVKKGTEGEGEQRRTNHRGNLCFSRSAWMGVFRYSLWPSLSPALYSSKCWRSPGLAWV